MNGDESDMARKMAFNNKPVILNKCASPVTNDGENPFGSSFCYGTSQLIVEVCNWLYALFAFIEIQLQLMDNSHIASAVLFE